MEIIEAQQVSLGAGQALIPPALTAADTRAVIVLIRFVLDDTEFTSRLDIQKAMFIDPLPAVWEVDKRAIAQQISQIIRAERERIAMRGR
jgi:hypothetical protein